MARCGGSPAHCSCRRRGSIAEGAQHDAPHCQTVSLSLSWPASFTLDRVNAMAMPKAKELDGQGERPTFSNSGTLDVLLTADSLLRASANEHHDFTPVAASPGLNMFSSQVPHVEPASSAARQWQPDAEPASSLACSLGRRISFSQEGSALTSSQSSMLLASISNSISDQLAYGIHAGAPCPSAVEGDVPVTPSATTPSPTRAASLRLAKQAASMAKAAAQRCSSAAHSAGHLAAALAAVAGGKRLSAAADLPGLQAAGEASCPQSTSSSCNFANVAWQTPTTFGTVVASRLLDDSAKQSSASCASRSRIPGAPAASVARAEQPVAFSTAAARHSPAAKQLSASARSSASSSYTALGRNTSSSPAAAGNSSKLVGTGGHGKTILHPVWGYSSNQPTQKIPVLLRPRVTAVAPKHFAEPITQQSRLEGSAVTRRAPNASGAAKSSRPSTAVDTSSNGARSQALLRPATTLGQHSRSQLTAGVTHSFTARGPPTHTLDKGAKDEVVAETPTSHSRILKPAAQQRPVLPVPMLPLCGLQSPSASAAGAANRPRPMSARQAPILRCTGLLPQTLSQKHLQLCSPLTTSRVAAVRGSARPHADHSIVSGAFTARRATVTAMKLPTAVGDSMRPLGSGPPLTSPPLVPVRSTLKPMPATRQLSAGTAGPADAVVVVRRQHEVAQARMEVACLPSTPRATSGNLAARLPAACVSLKLWYS